MLVCMRWTIRMNAMGQTVYMSLPNLHKCIHDMVWLCHACVMYRNVGLCLYLDIQRKSFIRETVGLSLELDFTLNQNFGSSSNPPRCSSPWSVSVDFSASSRGSRLFVANWVSWTNVGPDNNEVFRIRMKHTSVCRGSNGAFSPKICVHGSLYLLMIVGFDNEWLWNLSR